MGPAAEAAAPAIIKILEDEAIPLDKRGWMMNPFGTLHTVAPDAAVPISILIQHLKSPSWEDQLHTALYLWDYGKNGTAALPALREALEEQAVSDMDYWPRKEA